ATEEPRMLRQLDHFTEIARRRALRPRANGEAGRLDPRQIMIVDLVSMPMAFRNARRPVDAVRERPGNDIARLRAEPHRAAELGARIALFDRAVAVLPRGDEWDDRMRRERI